MQPLTGKIVLITGASSGIGQACARQFAAAGAKLILVARREQKLQRLAQELETSYSAVVLARKLDLVNHAEITSFFQALPEEWRAIDVLVNNAGLALGVDPIAEANPADWDKMIDTNVKGLLYVTREVVPGMLARNSGHVINIGSISSYEVYPGGAVYCATKFAVRALSDGLKMDVHGSQIRVSEIDPGMVRTEFSMVRFDNAGVREASVYEGVNYLTAEDVADAVIYCATRPQHVDVRCIKLYPTDQTAAHMVNRHDK